MFVPSATILTMILPRKSKMKKEWTCVEKPWVYHGKWNPSGVPRQKTLGFWPWVFPRDSIHHDTPSAFPHIRSREWSCDGTKQTKTINKPFVCLFD